MEKEVKVKTAKKSKYPEGYIGRPKPMKTKTFEFHKPTLKNYIGLGILVVILGLLTWLVIELVNVGKLSDAFIKAYQFDSEKAEESYVLENDKLIMNFDVATTQFSITQKDTGHVWYSNPQDLDSDPIALQKEKNNMLSTLLVKYSTENGVNNVYDSWTYSIKRNFFETEKTGNEIIVKYTVSQMEREYKYPLAIYESEMDEYLEQMNSKDQNVITRRCYRLVDIEKLKASDNEAELIQKYPDLYEDNLYLIFDPLNGYLKEQCEEIFAKIGYSDEDYMRHYELYKEKNDKVEPAFNITVHYKLEGDSLVVEVPFDDILYKRAYPIVQLSVLPYFGAAGTSEEGFLFVPEGGGSLIDFNNGKTRQNGYYADVYGWDYASDRSAVIKETRVAYPVFGESEGDSSFISIIKNGAEYAGITAEISGKLASYNYVRADYKMIHGEQFEVSTRNTSAQYSYEPHLPAGEKITQVYKFIPSPSYVDMATSYREYLFGNSKRTQNKTMPIAVEIVGAVDKVQQVMGLPKTMPYKLTSYSEAAEIIKSLDNELGIKNSSIKLSGFFNGGIRQKMLNNFSWINSLGGASGIKKMLNEVSNTSAKLYLDGTMQFAYRTGSTAGFNRYRDPARFASDEVCKLQEYSPVWYGKLDTLDSYFLLRPSNIAHASDVFIKNAKKYGFESISYRDNGYQLSADYNDSRLVSRGQARIQQQEKMKLANDEGLGIMINAGNDYALPYTDFITNMTQHGNSYAIIDRQVPFYQIALHGYKNYAGSAVNLGYEINQAVLESAETGAGLYFVFMHEPEKILQETNYTEYYAACFDTWKDRLKNIYSRYNSELNPVSNSLISDHEYISDSVTCTSFDNGYDVIVNFGYVDYTTDSGAVIPARDYKVIKGGM
ncbi:MAG: hypothetical protein K5829_09310 [Treponema sp.]|nr:hypothetical protein [Treponema sp.]